MPATFLRCRPAALPLLLSALAVLPVAVDASALPKRPRQAPKAARFYNGSWFHTFRGNLSWPEAEAKCEQAGGHLVVVPDRATWNFVRALIPEERDTDFWLGATDLEKEGTWKWVDGTTATFFAWRPGEPNSANGEEDYLSSPWADFPIATKYIGGYVCQWRSFDTMMDLHFVIEDQNPDVAAALKTLREELRKAARDPHAAALRTTNTLYLSVLTREAEAASKRQDEALATAIKNEKALVEAGTSVPAEDKDTEKDTPPALAKLRQAHRALCEKVDDERTRQAAPIVRRHDATFQKLEAEAAENAADDQVVQIKALRASLLGLGM